MMWLLNGNYLCPALDIFSNFICNSNTTNKVKKKIMKIMILTIYLNSSMDLFVSEIRFKSFEIKK